MKQEQFNKLMEIKQKGKIEAEEKPLLQSLYLTIFPMTRMDMQCPACLRSYIDQLLTYYQDKVAKNEVKESPVTKRGKK